MKRFRKTLGLDPETPFLVGHTPMDQIDTYWLNVGAAENHHILYSAHDAWVGVFTRIGGKMWPLKYPAEPLRDLIKKLATDDKAVEEQQQSNVS